MLLRRFPILNKLSLATLEAQGLTREVIQVSLSAIPALLCASYVSSQSGVAHELIRRNKDLVFGSSVNAHPDLLSRLRESIAGYSAQRKLTHPSSCCSL